MPLSLYRETGNGTYRRILTGLWIIGFVPNIHDYSIREEELVTIASVDFSQDAKMYEELKAAVEGGDTDVTLNADVIFDDEIYTIWIIW